MPHMADPTYPGDPHARGVAAGAAADVAEVKAEIRTKLDRIEALLGYLTAKALTGGELRATDPAVLSFFGISDKHPNPIKRIAEIGALRYAKKLGVVECQSCGSNVHDLEGVTEETCSFCGATVKTGS